MTNPRIALVLGGGGLKGFAHIGVLKALEERGIVPSVFAGTSIGALLAAARAGGMTADEMRRRAESLKRRDLFRINHFGMLMERMRSPSIYLEDPLRELCRSVAPGTSFAELPTKLFVNTVDIERGTPVVWGAPGLDHVNVQDAVYASCALPGFFPPGRVDGRLCVDGGVVDNLPVSVASFHADLIIAVDVGSGAAMRPVTDAMARGFASIYMRAAATMMRALQQFPLSNWNGPPMVLIRPNCGEDWLSFGNTAETIASGYRAATAVLPDLEKYYDRPGGVYPRSRVELEVLDDRCTGCGLCAALAPGLMGIDSRGIAFPRTRTAEWSPADGAWVGSCPTGAIVVKREEVAEPPAEEAAA